jgi:segregation and condensation protein B
LFATTRQFLDDLGLASLEQLPLLQAASGLTLPPELAEAQAVLQAEGAAAEAAAAQSATEALAAAAAATGMASPEPDLFDPLPPLEAAPDAQLEPGSTDVDVAAEAAQPLPTPDSTPPAADAAPMEPEA